MLTNLPNASIWAEPCLMNVESRRINGVTFPLRSHRGGASRQGKRAQYGSGMGPLASRTSKRTDNIWKTYGINSVISCCKIPWNTGKSASSKELTAVASAWQTILRYVRKEFISAEFAKLIYVTLTWWTALGFQIDNDWTGDAMGSSRRMWESLSGVEVLLPCRA